MSRTGVYHVRLTSSEEVFARYLDDEGEIIVFDTPMKIGEVSTPSGVQVVLFKYMPWTKNQTCVFNKSHIVSMSEVHPEVAKFYLNTIAVQEIHSEPFTYQNMAQANEYMSHVLSKDNIAFHTAAKKFNVDLNQMDYNKPN